MTTFLIGHNIMTTFLILCCPSFAAKTALTHLSMDSTRPMEVYCSIWLQDFSSISFRSCKLWSGASIDWTCLFSTSHRCFIGLRSGEYGELIVFLKPFLNHFSFVALAAFTLQVLMHRYDLLTIYMILWPVYLHSLYTWLVSDMCLH